MPRAGVPPAPGVGLCPLAVTARHAVDRHDASPHGTRRSMPTTAHASGSASSRPVVGIASSRAGRGSPRPPGPSPGFRPPVAVRDSDRPRSCPRPERLPAPRTPTTPLRAHARGRERRPDRGSPTLVVIMVVGPGARWFLVANEADVHPIYRDRLLHAAANDTVLTGPFDVGWPNAPHRVIRNENYTNWEAAGRPPSGARSGEGEIVATGDGSSIVRYSDAQPTSST